MRTWFFAHQSEQHRRRERSRLRMRIPFLSCHDRDASLAIERRLDYLEHERIRVCRIQRRIFHRLEPDATEKKSGHGRADSRQDRPALWKLNVDSNDDEGASLIVQPRHAGR